MINVSEEMKHLHKLARQNRDHRFTDLWEKLTHPLWLAQAWEEIHRHKGSQTPGVDQKTAVDVDFNLIIQLAERLKAGQYQPKPARRVHVPKANGKRRPLGISTIEDRIVQQALKMILEPIFEADFRNCSHGFRQGRSTHTALRDVAIAYPSTTWIIEGDIEGCFDGIPHGNLLQQMERRIADEKILHLIRAFLKAGYLEEWRYHRTYSGTPQGSIVSPILANVFLHQLDEFVEDQLKANQTQSRKQQIARINPEYKRIAGRITYWRRKLKKASPLERKALLEQLKTLERERKKTAYFTRDRKHPCKIKYVRYADDWLILVNGPKREAEEIKKQVKEKLSQLGLKLSEEKTKITHWRNVVHFLGYSIRGKRKARGGIKAVLCIPPEKMRKIKEALAKLSRYHHIPEADAIVQLSALFRGWCNYYRYANAPQETFAELARFLWWQYAHFLARKQKSSIAQMIRRERKAERLKPVEKAGRKRNTFQYRIGEKTLILDLFPPKTAQIRRITYGQNWEVDLKPITPWNWQSGRSLATRLAALERANGLCERCKEKPVEHVHHTVPLRSKSFLARTMSDQAQQYTARALCKECHLEVHGGSFNPRKQGSSRNAGYAERCSSSVGRAA